MGRWRYFPLLMLCPEIRPPPHGVARGQVIAGFVPLLASTLASVGLWCALVPQCTFVLLFSLLPGSEGQSQWESREVQRARCCSSAVPQAVASASDFRLSLAGWLPWGSAQPASPLLLILQVALPYQNQGELSEMPAVMGWIVSPVPQLLC